MTFTNSDAIENYLNSVQSNGVSTLIPATITNPTSGQAGQIGAQLITSTVNVLLDYCDAVDSLCQVPLDTGGCISASASTTCTGATVQQVIAASNFAIGGCALTTCQADVDPVIRNLCSSNTLSQLSDCLDAINNNKVIPCNGQCSANIPLSISQTCGCACGTDTLITSTIAGQQKQTAAPGDVITVWYTFSGTTDTPIGTSAQLTAFVGCPKGLHTLLLVPLQCQAFGSYNQTSSSNMEIPDLCDGGQMDISLGASFSGYLSTLDGSSSSVSFKYGVTGSTTWETSWATPTSVRTQSCSCLNSVLLSRLQLSSSSSITSSFLLAVMLLLMIL